MILLSPECTLWKNYGNEAGSVLGKSVKSNKTLYRPCTAVSYTLTHDNLIEVANIITTSGVLHHCSLNLGVFTSVQVTMLYLEEKPAATNSSQYFRDLTSHYLQGYQQHLKCVGCGVTVLATTRRPKP